MPLLKTPTPEGHTDSSDCQCWPSIQQYQDEQSGKWWTRIVHVTTDTRKGKEGE